MIHLSYGIDGKLSDDAITAARMWYKNQSIELTDLKKLPAADAAKRLTKAVYSFCESGPQKGHINNLFYDCKTACGGYSYVLRGLLEALGLRTRNANLYNIPEQGNHTAVEVKIGDKWRFFDPTFGSFFTDNGTPQGDLMSLRELVKTKQIKSENVFRVIDRNNTYVFDEIGEMYTNKFALSEPFRNGSAQLSISSYQSAEQISYRNPMFLLPLQINLNIKDKKHIKFGSLKKDDAANLESEWLKLTNDTLNDKNPYNDISFNTSYLYNSNGQKLTIVKIDGLKKNVSYQISLLLTTKQNDSKIQVTSLGKFVRSDFEVINKIKKGTSVLKSTFYTPFNSASFLIRNAAPNSMIRLFGVSIDELNKESITTQ